jgi:hypothetical protein
MKTAVAAQTIVIVCESNKEDDHHDFLLLLDFSIVANICIHTCSSVGLGPIRAPQFLILSAQLCIVEISDCWIHLGRNMAVARRFLGIF